MEHHNTARYGFILLILLLPFTLFAQNPRQQTPTGGVYRVSPFATISGSTEQNIYSDTIAPTTLPRFMKSRFSIKANVSTGVGLAAVNLRFVNGANTVTLINAIGLGINMTNRPLVITGEITNQGNGTALVYIVVAQDGGVLNGVSTYYAVRRVWSVDFSVLQPIQLKATLSGAGLGATTLGVDEIETQGF